jgi:hypothetical protein
VVFAISVKAAACIALVGVLVRVTVILLVPASVSDRSTLV